MCMGFGQRRLHFLLNNESLCVWGRVVGGWGSTLSWGKRSLTHSQTLAPLSGLYLDLPPQAATFFLSPHLHNSILDFSVLPFFIPVFHGHCLSVGNISSGTENITEVTETTLTPTSTLAQQQEMYVFHLHTHVSHMRYIYQAVCGWSIWSCLCADEKF